jgi:hypothetical protein
VRTLLYEAANVILTRYKGDLKLKDWASQLPKRSTMRKARVALLHAVKPQPTALSTEPPCTQLTPSSAERARRERRHPKASIPGRSFRLDPLENGIGGKRAYRSRLEKDRSPRDTRHPYRARNRVYCPKLASVEGDADYREGWSAALQRCHEQHCPHPIARVCAQAS